MQPLLETHELTKYYRSDWTFRRTLVVDRLSLAVGEGEIFGLLGPNGAGKTTTFKLLLGFLRPSHGSVAFRGRPIRAQDRVSIGFLPERPYFYDYLSVEEALALFAQLNGIARARRRARVDAVIERLQLGQKRHAALRTLSKGFLQRVGVAQAILAEPKLVILDEPMSGLDPMGRRDMRELIADLRRQGTSVIFSSHILPDVEALCDRVAILVAGTLREVLALNREASAHAYELGLAGAPPDLVASLERLAGRSAVADGSQWSIQLPSLTAANEALDLARRANTAVTRLAPRDISLEQRFLAHAGPETARPS